jgi:hypothetical protein
MAWIGTAGEEDSDAGQVAAVPARVRLVLGDHEPRWQESGGLAALERGGSNQPRLWAVRNAATLVATEPNSSLVAGS